MRTASETLTFSSSGDMSQASITSNWVWIGHMPLGEFQFAYTGTATGTLTLETSCDYGGGGQTSQNEAAAGSNLISVIDTMTGSSTAIDAGATSNITIAFTDVAAQWVRAKYTKTAGTGTLSGRFDGKGW